MALLNPVYAVLFPFILTFSIPLVFLASITTTLALTVLSFRVLLVYIELAFVVIPYYLLGLRGPEVDSIYAAQFSQPSSPTSTRRRRRSSTGSSLSAESLQASHEIASLGQQSSVGATRDFEGVGGWKLDGEKEEDMLWLTMNPRVELTSDPVRRHRRSFTGGSVQGRVARSYSPETKMQANTPKARTSPTYVGEQGGASPRSLKKAMSATVVASGSTAANGNPRSSAGSGGFNMRRT